MRKFSRWLLIGNPTEKEGYPVRQTARRGTNLQSVRWQNRAAVLETLWRSQPISRKDLAGRTHLTAATLTNIMAELLEAGIVQETGPGKAGRGRRSTLLAFSSDSVYLLGVNLSRTELSVGLFNLLLGCRYLVTHPVALKEGASASETLINLIRLAISQSQINPRRIVGIGVSSPGPLSVSEGVIYAPPRFAEWSNLPLRKLLSQAFVLPVWLENDANANALAEHWMGVGRPYNNFIYVESHSGLGSGIILEGHLFNGSAGVASELGHTSIDRHGPRCACGNYGCVELYSSGPAIIERVRQIHAAGASTRLTQEAGANLERLTFEQVIRAAVQGDRLALEVIQDACRALALGLVNAVNLFNPEAIIIGHKLNGAGELCLSLVREIIQQQAIPQAAAHLKILPSQFTESVGVTGAACCALSSLLHEPSLLLKPSVAAGE